jgi:PRTRC genetic system protein B
MLDVQYQNHNQAFCLTHALLFYHDQSRQTLATLHRVRNKELLQGKAVDVAELDDLFHSPGQRTRMRIMPPQVIACSRTEVLWFERSRIRPIYFNIPESEAKRRFLNRISGEDVIWPNLLFKISREEIYCWAVKSSARPGLNKKLYRAPFTNIFIDDKVCLPNGIPDNPDDDIVTYAGKALNVIFRGHFSHLYGEQVKRIGYYHGLDRFWENMVKQTAKKKIKSFPAKQLIPTALTVRSVLS